MTWIHVYLGGAAGALALSALLTGVFRRLGAKWDLFDRPDSEAHKGHAASVPLLGGVAMFAAWLAVLGAGLVVASVVLAYGVDPGVIKAVLLLVFIFITNPTAAHAIARAAYEEGIEPWTEGDDRR